MTGTRPLPALDRRDVPTRPMTADEAQMARAVACCDRLRGHPSKSRMRMLHVRSLTAGRYITAVEAAELRSLVILFASKLEPRIVEMAKGGTDGRR